MKALRRRRQRTRLAPVTSSGATETVTPPLRRLPQGAVAGAVNMANNVGDGDAGRGARYRRSACVLRRSQRLYQKRRLRPCPGVKDQEESANADGDG